jgi:membrane protease subunit HflK
LASIDPARPSAIGALLRDSVLRLARPPRLGARGGWLLAALVLIAWLSTSLYKVQPDEQGVVQRFGHLVETTGPGYHLHLPFPIDIVRFSMATPATQAQPGAPAPRSAP